MGLTLHDKRVLGAWLLASMAFHAAILLMLPGMRASDSSRPEVLEVRFEERQPPRVLPPLPEPATPSPLPRSKAVPKKEMRRAPTVATPAARDLPIVARETPAAPPPILTTPQADAQVRSAPAEAEIVARQDPPRHEPPPQEAPRAALPPRKSDAAPRESSAAMTQPSFNAPHLRNPPTRYPLSARRNGEQGTVVLLVFVTKEGVPAKVSVLKTSGSTVLDQAAAEQVKGWRFEPARQGADPVDAWAHVPVIFKLDGAS
jgi:protein TonB